MLPAADLVFAVVVPLLREIGRDGQRAGCGRRRSTRVGRSCAACSADCSARGTSAGDAEACVFATPTGERHELGLLCAAVLIASAGWGVVYLGADVPAGDVLHAATVTGARVVLLSATSPGAVARNELRKLAALPPDVELWIGGPEAETLAAPVGERARHIAALDDLIPMLSKHVR